MASTVGCLLIFFCLTFVAADEIDVELNKGSVIKFLRAMTNETKGADTLNLPANATSIRENITDTFSCENRTYGYYADVDNDCQIFHVCLPSQTPSGRNITYRWSFICPAETVFNQEVLVCTRSREAIPCEESPMYYDVNLEFGRVIDENETEDPKKETVNIKHETDNPKKETVNIKPTKPKNKKTQNRRPVNQKQNIIAEFLSVDEKVDEELNEMGYEEIDGEEIVPVLVENETKVEEIEDQTGNNSDEGRLIEERSMKWNGRKLRRGGFRFKSDV